WNFERHHAVEPLIEEYGMAEAIGGPRGGGGRSVPVEENPFTLAQRLLCSRGQCLCVLLIGGPEGGRPEAEAVSGPNDQDRRRHPLHQAAEGHQPAPAEVFLALGFLQLPPELQLHGIGAMRVILRIWCRIVLPHFRLSP